jgi:beta-lactamase class C CMY-1
MRPTAHFNSRSLVLWFVSLAAVVFLTGCLTSASDRLRRDVDAAIVPMMQEHNIPGLAVAVIHEGNVDFFSYGVASRETGKRVDQHTIFEIGSISKTFTGLLGAYVSAQGGFSLEDPVSRSWAALAGSAFDNITMGQLATYAAGGLPLQFPSNVTNDEEMLAYFREWKPTYPPGAYRCYSNPSIGLFGRVAARSSGEDFEQLMTRTILPALGLSKTYLRVPPSQVSHYAFGYGNDNLPIRVNPGMFDTEAYGIKTSAADMSRFLCMQMAEQSEQALAHAIALTHVGRFSVGPMTQGLGWEMYPYPVTLQDLLAGNSPDIIFEPNPTAPPINLGDTVLVNKTGSTGGFGAYVAFIPAKKLGVILLANRNYPIAARVTAAYEILHAVER